MTRGKFGRQLVDDDDYDYDDEIDEDYEGDVEEEEEEEEEEKSYDTGTRSKGDGTSKTELKRGQSEVQKPGPGQDEDELNDLLSQLIPSFSSLDKGLRESKISKDGSLKAPEPQAAGASALARYLIGPPPLRPSGKAQKAGRPDLASRVSQQAVEQQPYHKAASTIPPFRFDRPSPDDQVHLAQGKRGVKPDPNQSWLTDIAKSSAAGYDAVPSNQEQPARRDPVPKAEPRNSQGEGTGVNSDGWQKIPAHLLMENQERQPVHEPKERLSDPSHADEPAADHRYPRGQTHTDEVDENGWQKLPLHLEMTMMQQAARGEDGTPALQAVERPRERWWKDDRERQHNLGNGEVSLRQQTKLAATQERQPPAEYVMDPDLKALCDQACADEQKQLEGRSKLHLVVLGHVDAGKSTLMGRLLHELGVVSQKTVHKHQKEAAAMGKGSFAWAWLLDERPQERARGVTIDVASAHFNTPKHAVTLLDAPGHRDFVPNMIAGAAQADAALLLVDGSKGNFEAGFESSSGYGSLGGGQTREHAQLARSLGVDQIAVVISKLDTCDYSQARFEEIKAQLSPFLKLCGFRESAVQWLPAVGTANENLVNLPTEHELKSWWQGPTLVQAIDKFRSATRNVSMPLRLPINDIFKGDRGGQSMGGKLEAGAIKVGMHVCVMPSGEEGGIKSISIAGKKVELAMAGDSADVTLSDIDAGVLVAGSVLCHPEFPVPLVTKLEARIVILDVVTPVLQGQQVTLHAHATREIGHISRLIHSVDPKTGETSKKKPRVLLKGQSAVVEVTSARPVCLELYSECRALGRVILREGGLTIAVGIVVKILA